MEVIKTPLDGCVVIKADKFGDDRGFFMESFNQKKFHEAGISFEVKQINLAKSGKNVLRGLHFQTGSAGQTKLINVTQGAVRDVVVDIREGSSTYLHHFSYELTSPEVFLLVPKGFAHGYFTLSDDTIFQYAVDNYYQPEKEGGILYNDPKLSIDWGLKMPPSVSKKDLEHNLLT
jgi:dTDP-4-dehydrorhamnose 3,5-epimerase